ncbi:MAG TPA: hypothetical protein VGY55_04680 [Pirellulales bacterium]|nr:hypothetical protein [Pirellulales bacterium]
MNGVTIASGFFVAVTPVAMAACGAAMLARGFRAVRGTTLLAPWLWSIGSLAIVAISETAIAVLHAAQTPATAQLRLAAAATTFCPLVALLGAKRPQDRAWQWIVLSFWVILSLPTAEAWLMRPSEPPTVHPVWSWFLAVLVFFGCANYLPTRFWPAAILAAAGQIVLNWSYLPAPLPALPEIAPLMGLGMLVAALVAASVIGVRPLRGNESLDRLWLDYRDRYGAVWGLRVAERINAAAKSYGWDVRLGWYGFTAGHGGLVTVVLPEQRAEIEKSLRTVLRRFVSAEWIDRRLAVCNPHTSLPSDKTGIPTTSEA